MVGPRAGMGAFVSATKRKESKGVDEFDAPQAHPFQAQVKYAGRVRWKGSFFAATGTPPMGSVVLPCVLPSQGIAGV